MRYSLCGIPLHLRGAASEAAEILSRLFSLAPPSGIGQEAAIPICIGDKPEPAVTGETVFASSGLTSVRTGNGYHLRSLGAYLSIDLARGTATGTLSPEFRATPLEEQRGLFLFALLLLLSTRGLYALHAGAAVSPDGHGVLLVGSAGSGKTTLTCVLSRSGWDYLSDDSVLLRRSPHGLEAHAFGRPFHCTAATVRHFAELGQCTLPGGLTPKRLIDVAAVYPGRFRSHTPPSMILFPEIVREPETRVIPLTRRETLLRLLRQGVGLAHDLAGMASQMELLSELTSSARGYRLLHGADVHRSPESVAAHIRQLARQGDPIAFNSAA